MRFKSSYLTIGPFKYVYILRTMKTMELDFQKMGWIAEAWA